MENLNIKAVLKKLKNKIKLNKLLNNNAAKSCLGLDDNFMEVLEKSVITKAEKNKIYFKNSFGVKTRYSDLPFTASPELKFLNLPVPNDSYMAETIEYFGVLDSILYSSDKFVMVELGAGWGPWLALGGVQAKYRKIKDITLIGAEASPERMKRMKQHLEFNGLNENNPDSKCKCLFYQNAVGTNRQQINFSDSSIEDMGSAVMDGEKDYRGVEKCIQADMIPLTDITESLENIDIMHFDIQGSEYEVISTYINEINKKVKALVIGIHSRQIEADLMNLLYKNGWELCGDFPCKVHLHTQINESIEALTYTDGTQYWRNKK